ncbi:MAG: Sucrose-phosphate synthase [Trebouxia sp. A1-2]|nr:MAG: Sucrose-phosphate synthase [Trebouxia sp. A1-2]
MADANNRWVESYLDALLSEGLSSEYIKNRKTEDGDVDEETAKFDSDRQVNSKYFVNQILQQGEEGLRDAWSKATSAKHYEEKDARLEYLSWRVWFMKRNHARVKREDAKTLAAEKVDLPEDDHVLDTEDASDEETPLIFDPTASQKVAGTTKPPLSESSKRPQPSKGVKPVAIKSDRRTLDDEEVASPGDVSAFFDHRVDGLYIILISLHGLVRGQQMELGKDPDTGGQIKYVVELASALAKHPAVYRVDLLTRLIKDPKVAKEYGQEEECILKPEGAENDLGGAYIVRLPCGPVDQYIRKEKLWPHVREFADRGIAHAKRMVTTLAEAKTPCELYVIHGHYADAGEVAALMSSTLDVDMCMTGHSLGRNKLEHLLASGTVSKAEIESTYKISRRVEAEERALESAIMVFTSTKQEIDEQWGLYDGRRTGRHMPYMNVIPPGLDFSNLKVDLPEDPVIKEMQQHKPAYGGSTPKAPHDSPKSGGGRTPKSMSESTRDFGDQPEPPIWKEISKYLRNPHKPAILAMSRPDPKKNITTLVKAFGENKTLRGLANLVLIMGNRELIDSMAGGSAKVLTQVLKLIDNHDLYGSVAYPKRHTQKDISDIYRLCLATHGVFTNVALQEPFGLTVIEAAAHGVPTVATKNGGPVDIMSTLHHGLLVDPNSSKEIADALVKILTEPKEWEEMSHNGIKNIMAYSWPSHCKQVLESLEKEKQYTKTHTKHKGRLSGSLDVSNRGAMDRMMSTPLAAKERGITHRISKDRADFWKEEQNQPKDKKDNHTGSNLRGQDRKHFVVVPLDGAFRVKDMAPSIQAVKKAAAASNGAVGVGLVSMMGFEHTRNELSEADVDLDGLDWIVCHSGADIWHGQQDGQWEADDHWEQLIDFRHAHAPWDRVSLQRLLTKLMTAPTLLTPAPSVKGLSPLARALASMPDPDKEEKGVHPQHVCIQLDRESKSILGQGTGNHKLAVSTAVVDRLRRRLRSNGFRAHLTLQMVPEDDDLISNVHITPLRASRALALRYLANKFNLDMERITVIVLPPTVSKKNEMYQVGSYTSDLAELVSGLNKVFIEIPKQDQAFDMSGLDSGDIMSVEKLTIKVGPKLFGDRVQFIQEQEHLDDVVKAAKVSNDSK